MRTKYWFIICVAVGLICFLIGRSTVPMKETVKIVEGKPIRETARIPIPVKETVPGNPILIYKRDTIYTEIGRVVYEKVDTAAIIQDYIIKRLYAFEVYNDDFGRMKIDSMTVQYNQLTGFHYTRIPKKLETVRTTEPKITPFAVAAYNTFNQASIQGGIFYRNAAVTYRYIFDTQTANTAHEIGVGVKF